VTNTVIYDPIGAAAPPDLTREAPFRVGILGRLAPWKGQDVFLEAFAPAFPDDDSEAWVVGAAMFGEDGYADTLDAQARRLGISDRVEFRGFREDVRAELSHIHLLVHCSLTPEPFARWWSYGAGVPVCRCAGVPVCRCAGVPVIAADSGGRAEIITHNVDGM